MFARDLTFAGLLSMSLAAATARTVVVVPHPDDESIGIAGTIRQQVLAGEEIWVVLATHGESSGVFPRLNGESYCSQCGRTHNPVGEGYLAADLVNGKLTRATFGNARVREFHASLNVIGVPQARRRVYNRAPITRSIANQLVSELVAEFGPDTKYITVQVDPQTPHSEHHYLAEALAADTVVPAANKSYYAVYEFYSTTHPATPGAANPKWIGPWRANKYEAMQQYKVWNPSGGRYRIAFHSTAALIDNSSVWDYEYPMPIPNSSSVGAWELY